MLILLCKLFNQESYYCKLKFFVKQAHDYVEPDHIPLPLLFNSAFVSN